VTQRRLTAAQQSYAEKAMPLVPMVIGSYLKRNPDLMDVARRCDLDGTAEQAVCQAALTYNPERAGVSAYFSVAIHRAISKEIQARRNHERRMSLPDAAAYLGRMTGQKPHVSTLWRWCLKGGKGVKLDSICVGGKRFVTAAAIDYFIDASTNRRNDPRGASAALPPASSPPLPSHVIRHNERRRAQIEAARRRLDELTGVTKRARSGRKAVPPIRSPESPGRPGPGSARHRPG
jgi:hypothetical protein